MNRFPCLLFIFFQAQTDSSCNYVKKQNKAATKKNPYAYGNLFGNFIWKFNLLEAPNEQNLELNAVRFPLQCIYKC